MIGWPDQPGLLLPPNQPRYRLYKIKPVFAWNGSRLAYIITNELYAEPTGLVENKN